MCGSACSARPATSAARRPGACRSTPYLTAEPERIARWRGWLAERTAGARFRIGIGWQGNPRYRADGRRSIPLACFAPLLRLIEAAGGAVVSLQKGDGRQQLAALPFGISVVDVGSALDADGAFVDTAALMTALDLVITSDTAIPHLAGALGAAGLDGARRAARLALGAARRRVPLVSEHAPLSPDRGRRLGRRVPADRAGGGRTLLDSRCAVNLSVPIGPGELVDKITILEIKSERLASLEKLANVRVELAALVAARDAAIAASEALGQLTAALKSVNEALWRIEDEIRDCERSGDFGPRFIELARAVYRSNDERAALKRQINDLLGSEIVEEKSYAAY